MSTRILIPAALLLMLAAAKSGRPPGSYEVRLAFTGYTGLAESRDCRLMVDTLGYDSLVGTVTGVETNEPDEDMVYTGTLKRKTKIDYCLAKPAPTTDQLAWCVAKLTGSASMRVELTVYGEADRGAWLKAQPVGAPDSAQVRGNCTRADMDSVRADYPSGESAGTPDGQAIDELTPPRFFVNSLARLRAGYFPPDPVQGGWGLRVVRATP